MLEARSPPFLSRDTLWFVCRHLNGVSLVRLGCTSTFFRQFCLNDEVWRDRLAVHLFPKGLSISWLDRIDETTLRGKALAQVRLGPPFVTAKGEQLVDYLPCFKVFMGGWYGAGKTSFLISFAEQRFVDPTVHPFTSVPCVYDLIWENGTVKEEKVSLLLQDWFVQMWDDANLLVMLGFANTDICILNFSVGSRERLNMLNDFWVPNMRRLCPDVLFVLHAMQIDLRETGEDFISREEGLKLAKDLGDLAYFESSAKTGVGVREVIGGAIELKLRAKMRSATKKQAQKKNCNLQ